MHTVSQASVASMRICACLPSSGSTPKLLLQVVQHEPLRFPESPAVSPELKDLLQRMLCKVGALHGLCRALTASGSSCTPMLRDADMTRPHPSASHH